jgi:hypothetical protein
MCSHSWYVGTIVLNRRTMKYVANYFFNSLEFRSAKFLYIAETRQGWKRSWFEWDCPELPVACCFALNKVFEFVSIIHLIDEEPQLGSHIFVEFSLHY